MKYCSGCKATLPLDNFGINEAKADGRQTQCKVCRNGYAKRWYGENKDAHMERVRRSETEYRKFFYELMSSKSCVKCGEDRVPCLQYDHRDPKEKSFGIVVGIKRGYAKSRILAEIAKCDVLCANCHAIRTAEQFGWYSFMATGQVTEIPS